MTLEMSVDSGEGADAVRRGLHSSAVVLVRSTDPDGTALAVAEALDADLLSADEARAAVDATWADETASGVGGAVLDIDELDRLATRLAKASGLVDDTRHAVAERAQAGRDLVLHPDTLRSAAADVLDARADLLEVERALGADRFRDTTQTEPDRAVDRRTEDEKFDQFIGAGDHEDEDEDDQGWSMGFLVGLLVVEVLLGFAVLLGGGGPVAFLLPAATMVWLGVLLGRGRRAKRSIAADERVDVSERLTSIVSRRPGSLDPDPVVEPPAIAAARRRLDVADARWRSLVGPDVDVDDLEGQLAARDAQHDPVAGRVADDSASVRAAARHLRRVRGEWRAAWWALDLVPPSVTDATSALAALRERGLEAIVLRDRPQLCSVVDGGDDIAPALLAPGRRFVVVTGEAPTRDGGSGDAAAS